VTGQLLTPAEVAKAYRYELSYVYRLASMHGWKRLRYEGRVYYDVLDVATALQRPA
jgi:hypothetical protein